LDWTLVKRDALGAGASDYEPLCLGDVLSAGFAIEVTNFIDARFARDCELIDDAVRLQRELAVLRGGSYGRRANCIWRDIAAGHAVAAEVAGGARGSGAAESGLAHVNDGHAEGARAVANGDVGTLHRHGREKDAVGRSSR